MCYNKYTKNLKRNINKGLKNRLEISKNIEIDAFILMKKTHAKHKIKKKELYKIKSLIIEIIKKEKGTLYGIKKEDELIAIAFFTKSNNRLIHLFSVSNSIGKKFGAIPFLFNTIIKNNANTNVVFDFEGSMIEGVAKFFKSFGSENNPYLKYRNV